MGDFRIVIQAVGGHGCDRKALTGEALAPTCGKPRCPDCSAREFVRLMVANHTHVKTAELTHWPADLPDIHYPESGEVKDDLLTGKHIKGQF